MGTTAGIERDLADYFIEAIKNDYLITVLITSYTKAKRKTENLPFGLGKTTLMFWFNYYMNGRSWDKVFETTTYNPYSLAELLKPNSERKSAVSWDDVQSTAPAEQGVPRAIRRLANFLSTERPEIACLLMTAPNISMISSPIRKLVIFEVIVSERGKYEVQKISYYKHYKDPLHDIARLDYLEESPEPEYFKPLPVEILDRYKKWRATEKMKLYPSLLAELQTYIQLRDFDPEGKEASATLEGTVVRGAHGYVIELPKELGENLHRQRVVFSRPTPVT